MILTMNVGNSAMSLGVFDGGELRFSTSAATDARLTRDELRIKINASLGLYGVTPDMLEGAVIASVVPPMSKLIYDAVEAVLGKKPIVVGPGTKTGLNINIDYPNELGADIVATSAGALTKYMPPMIIIDVGTATTFSAIDENGCYQGCAICPGVKTSYDALAAATAQLPRISIGEVGRVIGKSSVDSMHSGLIHGFSSMLDGMLDKFSEELGQCDIIATGRMAEDIIKHCKREIKFDKTLIHTGLYSIYMRNVQKKKGKNA